MLKRLTALFSALIMTVCTVSCAKEPAGSSQSSGGGANAVTNDLTMTFLDVGKADAIILRADTSTVIIDCGEKADGKTIQSRLEEEGVTEIDALIITHFDKDHVGGASKIIKNFDVKKVYAPDYTNTNEESEKYRAALDTKGMTADLVTSDITFSAGGVDYTIYAPHKTFYGADNDNDYSLVTKAVHGSNTILFTGDAMETRLDEIMDIGKCDLLKIPYHGRKLDNLGPFLKAVQPKYAVTCTSANEFANSVQKLLKNMNIASYATCYNGTITAVSDGSGINITTER